MKTNIIDKVQQVIKKEADTLYEMADNLQESVAQFISLIDSCKGNILVIGVGKSGCIARKFAETLDSIGLPAFYFTPLEICHGCLGAVRQDDLVIAFSNSGRTPELMGCLCSMRNRDKSRNTKIISVIGKKGSPLEQISLCSVIFETDEAGAFGIIPSSSTTIAAAFGDAVAAALVGERNMDKEDYLKNHPGGAIGQMLHDVTDTGLRK